MAKPDSARGRYGAWVRRHRKLLFGNNIGALTTRLNAMGVAGQVETIRGWEAGASPSPEAIAALDVIFGEPAPEALEAPDTAAILDLADAIREQTQAMLERQEAQDRWLRSVVLALAESAAGPEIGARLRALENAGP